MNASITLWICVIVALAWQTFILWNRQSGKIQFLEVLVRESDDSSKDVSFWKAAVNFAAPFLVVYLIMMFMERPEQTQGDRG